MIGRLAAAAMTVAFFTWLAACSLEGSTREGSSNGVSFDHANPVIAKDLLSIFTQITIPFSTTIQVSSMNGSAMVDAVVQGLVQAGYGIQRVTTDQGANLLRVQRTKRAAGDSTYRYTLSVGNVIVSRQYDIDTRRVLPVSVFQISGSLVSASIDDSHFASGYREEFKAVTYTSFATVSKNQTAISLITDDLVDRVSNAATGGTTTQAINSSQIEISNLFNGESVFKPITDSHNRLLRQVLIFPNDSMTMGETNKGLVQEFLKNYETSRDQVRLIGCSNGHTNLDIGNEGLALGRAGRVSDELMRRGIPRDQILDEGCWAPVSAGNRFPGRGVVLELWRRKL